MQLRIHNNRSDDFAHTRLMAENGVAQPQILPLKTNHESAENIHLGHDIIKREPKADHSIQRKNSFEESPLSMV
jgi:hypothetical protein